MFYSRQRSGFTLVELLVVIAIIALLVAIAIPAILMAQERARRLKCANNLRELGGAIYAYEQAKRQYPGWINQVGSKAVGWPVMILDRIGRNDLWDECRTPSASLPAVQVDIFICPSSDMTGDSLSYVANCGQQDADFGSPAASPPIPPDWSANGVFFRHYDSSNSFVRVNFASDDLKDGQQYTLLLSENLQAGNWNNCQTQEYLGGMVWWLNNSSGVYATISQALTINRGLDTITGVAAGYSDARPSSNHPGGVNAVFCDGHTKFLNQEMDFMVLARLMATDDEHVKYAGTNTLMPDPLEPTKPFFQGKLSADDLE